MISPESESEGVIISSLSGMGVVGCEWAVDAFGCDAQRLRQLTRLRELCDRIVDELALKVVGQPHWHQFSGAGGVTGLYLLSESHLACHTYPEHGLATFNLYCCRAIARWPWTCELSLVLGATNVEVAELARGRSMPSKTQQDRKWALHMRCEP